MPLTPAELDALSAELAFARPDTCGILRLSNARGVGGGVKPARTTIGSFSCRVEPAQRAAVESVIGGRVVPAFDFRVFAPRGTVVREDDLLSVNGRELQVVGEASLASYHAEIEIQCKTVS